MDPLVRGYRGLVADLPGLMRRVAAARATLPLLLLRADRVCTREHLQVAAHLAARALAEGRARTGDHPTETLLYAAGEPRLHEASAFMGLREGMDAVAVVAWGPEEALDRFAAGQGWTRDDAVLEDVEVALAAFGVTQQVRAWVHPERWVEFVLERVRLVDAPDTSPDRAHAP